MLMGELGMSERSFAVWSVGLALVFGAVVPEPGKQQPELAETSGVSVKGTSAAPVQPSVLRPLQEVPLAVNHAVGSKSSGTPAVLWAAHSAR